MKSNLILILAVVLFFTALWYLELLIPFFVMYFFLDFFTDWRIMRRKSKENDQKFIKKFKKEVFEASKS